MNSTTYTRLLGPLGFIANAGRASGPVLPLAHVVAREWSALVATAVVLFFSPSPVLAIHGADVSSGAEGDAPFEIAMTEPASASAVSEAEVLGAGRPKPIDFDSSQAPV